MVLAIALPAWGQTLEEGKRAFDRGNYAEAASLFEQAHRQSTSCEILFYAGLARYRQNQTEPALIAFRSAVECDPKLMPAHLALGEAYSERHNDAAALEAYSHVLDLEPDNKAALNGSANIYLNKNANEKAVALMERLVRVDARNPDAAADLAAAYAASGNREAARQQFERALKLQPKHASALMGLGNLCLKNGDEDRAIKLLQAAMESAPLAPEPRFLLGSALNRLGRYREALAELQAAVRLGATESEVYYHLARAYGGLGRQEERAQALARFAGLTGKSKQDAEGQRRWLRLMDEAKSLVEAGNLNLAAARLEEAREQRPSDDQLLFRLASVHYDLRRFDVARGFAAEAIGVAPSIWLYRYLAGLIAEQSGRWAQARSSLETAVQLNGTAAEVHNALGEVALHGGNAEGAIASFERAVELQPKEPAYNLLKPKIGLDNKVHLIPHYPGAIDLLIEQKSRLRLSQFCDTLRSIDKLP